MKNNIIKMKKICKKNILISKNMLCCSNLDEGDGMKRYRWGILGTGKIANRFAAALNNIAGEAEFYAAGSRNSVTGKEFAARYKAAKAYGSYEALLNDPEVDIVYIGTPGRYHHEHVLAALKAGKNVLCEKALTLNAAEAEEIIIAAREKKLFLMEAMWTRFFPVHVKIRELIAGGAIGDPRGITANFSSVAPGSLKEINRFWDLSLGASALLDLGTYGVSFASSLFGPPEQITGVAYIGEGGFDYQNSCSLRYAGGRIASIINSQVSFDVKDAVIYGTEGRIEIEAPWYKPEAMVITRSDSSSERFEFPLNGFNGYEYEIREVISRLHNGEPESSIMPLDESLQIMRTLDDLRRQWGIVFPHERNKGETDAAQG